MGGVDDQWCPLDVCGELVKIVLCILHAINTLCATPNCVFV